MLLKGDVREMRQRRSMQMLVWSAYSCGSGVQTKVQKWGNCLGVRIPRGLAEEVGLGAGTEVSLTAKNGKLVLKPAVPRRLRLADLLAGVTPENIHATVDAGDAVGAEAF
jgi:antitoxin MazE